MAEFETARALLHEFKGDAYLYGMGVLERVGKWATGPGRRVALVADRFPGSEAHLAAIRESVMRAGVEIVGEVKGAGPNAPREHVFQIATELAEIEPDLVISFGGGSTIDATKAAEVLRTLGGEIDEYFGTGLVSRKIEESGKRLGPHLAIQSAASSGAHLTKYSNITDMKRGQKKLIVDEAIVPPRAVFDYAVTLGAPAALSADGALDGESHALEVLYGAAGKPHEAQVERVAREAIRLVIEYLPRVLTDPFDREGREALGLATDLGGYAIMLGGTNGAHLTSFSLVDIMSHGRACALMNPYYTVFFAPAIERPLRLVGGLFKAAGYTGADLDRLRGRELGLAVAQAMIAFARRISFPTTLVEAPGFTEAHVSRALTAARDPQLKMKLENMPVPLTAEMVNEYMGPILEAARTGELERIKNVQDAEARRVV